MKTRAIHKLFSFLLIGLFPMSLNGIVLNSHFCQGKLASLGIFAEAQECNDCTEGQCVKLANGKNCVVQQSSCCTNGHDYFKVTVETEESNNLVYNYWSNQYIDTDDFKKNVIESRGLDMIQNYGPPMLSKPSSYLLFGQLLI